MSLIHNDFIYIHIPKTGGTSIRDMLLVSLKDEICQYKDGDLQHKHIRLVSLPRELVDGKFTFSVVRNPWSHKVSWYEHMLKHDQSKKDMTFKDFLYKFNVSVTISQYLKDGFNKLYQVERFNEMLIDLSYRFDIQFGGIQFLNTNRHRDYTEYYTDELVKFVERRESELLKLFGYKFGEDINNTVS